MIRKKSYTHIILLWIIAFAIPGVLLIYTHHVPLVNAFPAVFFANVPIVIGMHFLGNLLLDHSAAYRKKEWVRLIILWLPPTILFYFTALSKDPFSIFVNYILAVPYILVMFFIIKYFKDEHGD